MTIAQEEALAQLVECGAADAVAARWTSHGFVGSRAASSLVDMGYANRKGPGCFVVSGRGRKALAAWRSK